MTQPHHFVFNELQRAIQKSVPIEPLVPCLLEKNIIKESDIKSGRFSGKNGMRNLTAALRNKSYETFVRFVECIVEAGSSDPSVKLSIVQSIEEAVVHFDKEHGTTHSSKIKAYKKSTVSTATGTDSEAQSILKLGSMPQFDYISTIATHTFDAAGGECDVSPFDFKITVPHGAVPADQTVTLKIGVMSHGPFRLPQDHYLITDYYCVIADHTFLTPVKIQMSHCAILSEYKQSSDIQILRSNLDSVTATGEYIFYPLPFFPNISSTHPHLEFEVTDFCVLCGTLKYPRSSHTSKKSHSGLQRQRAFDQRAPATASPQSSTEDVVSPRSLPLSYDSQFSSSYEEDSSLQSSQEASEDCEMVKTKPSRKRASESDRSDSFEKKAKCSVEYCLLMFQPTKSNKTPPFEVCLYACLSCPGSREACIKQMKNDNWNWKWPTYQEFEFDTTCTYASDKKLIFDVTETAGWQVTANKEPLEIHESDIQTHQKSRSEYQRLAKINFYPPRLSLEVMHDTYCTETLKCTIAIRGATTPITFTFGAQPTNVGLSSVQYPITSRPTPHCIASPQLNPLRTHAETAPLVNENIPEGAIATCQPKLDTTSSRDDLADQLKKFRIPRSMSDEVKEHCDKHVTDYCLAKVSHHIRPHHWKDLGRELGLSTIDLQHIECNNEKELSVERIYQTLLCWKKQNDSEPTYRILIKALDAVGEKEAMEYINTHVAEFAKSD